MYAGTKIMMIGPVVHLLCMGRYKETRKYAKILKTGFAVFIVLFALEADYFSEGFKACLESFGSKYRLKPTFCLLRSWR